MMRCPLVLGLLVIGGLLLAGCQPRDRDESPALTTRTLLELDPTEEHDLRGWWTNGQDLLHLRRDFSYRLWPQGNRYHTPRERGRWSHPSYAFMRLEPYTADGPAGPRRVSLGKRDGELIILLPDRPPLMHVEQPPKVMEDRVMGQWWSEIGMLELDDRLRYRLMEPDRTIDPAPLRTTQNGVWRITGERTLVLTPHRRTLDPMRLRITIDDASGRPAALAGEDVRFIREAADDELPDRAVDDRDDDAEQGE